MTKGKGKVPGGWPAIGYVLDKARGAGIGRMARAMATRNACKTCGLGMGGQHGGMTDERGHFAVCKKSVQAMAADLQPAVPAAFFRDHDFAALRAMTPRALEASGRLAEPLYAGPGDTGYRPLPWDEAVTRIAARLTATPPDEAFFYVSGRSANEAGFLLQLLARAYGTNNVHNSSYYCHQATGVALGSSIGSGTATVALDGLGGADLLFLIGANPASNHPRLLHALIALKERGGRIIVINPVREPGLVRFKSPAHARSLLLGSAIADLYLQPHIGGDIAVLSAVAKAVVEANAADEASLAAHTDGWEPFQAHLAALSWPELLTASGLTRADIDACAGLYAGARNAVFCWGMGVTHHVRGVDTVRAIVNLALLRGMVGGPSRGLLPLRGHSNIQGVGSVGVVPMLKPAMAEAMRAHFGVAPPARAGLDTLACLEEAHAGRMRFGLCLGGNLYGASPDAAFAAEALGRLDMVVHVNTTLNTGHAWGRGRETIVLPVHARDEESQATTQESMFNYVRLSDGGPVRHPSARSETALVIDLAEAVLGGPDSPVTWDAFRRHDAVRAAMAAVVPGYGAIGSIDASRQEFHVAGRILTEPAFPTATGRARLHAVPPTVPAKSPAGAGPQAAAPPRGHGLRLMTLRSEGQFNTVVYEDEDLYRGQDRRDVILMSAADVAAFGLRPDQPVTVRSGVGTMTGVRVRVIDIRPGNAAMYFPEANVLVPRTVDPESRTPAYKNVPVWLEAENG